MGLTEAPPEMTLRYETLATPPPEDLAGRLLSIWATIFETPYDSFRPVLRGDESEWNEDTYYLAWDGEQVIGSSHLTVPKADRRLGGLGEVVTLASYRGLGIASEVCQRARDTFFEQGGEALFLGTHNPVARRVYERLGWKQLVGSNVMGNFRTATGPEAFLNQYFATEGPFEVVTGSPQFRIPMIPLVLTPQSRFVLDANTRLGSTHHFVQHSCMSLYPRYQEITTQRRGAWFAAVSKEGRLVGLSTATLDELLTCWLDGFTHPSFPDAWPTLIDAGMQWATRNRAAATVARVLPDDAPKQEVFEQMGFEAAGQADPIRIGELTLPSRRLSWKE